MKKTLMKAELTIPKYRSVITETQTVYGTAKSWRRVDDGTQTATVELRIDVEALMRQLGPQAIRAKGKKSRLAGGLVEAIVIR